MVIIGPSGSGKSTFLRTINQLTEHQRGDIIVDGVLLNHDTRNIDAVRRNIGMVAQEFNLFPHMSILDNITLAPMKVLKEDPPGRPGTGGGAPRTCRDPGAGRQAAPPALIRRAAKGRHRPGPRHEAQHHAPG